MVVATFAVLIHIAGPGNRSTYPFRSIGAKDGAPVALYANGGVGQYTTLEQPVGTPYQVPSGETFTISRVVWSTPSTGGAVVIGYATANVTSTGSEPTGAMYLIGSSGDDTSLRTPDANTVTSVDIFAEAPAGTFPFIRTSRPETSVSVFGVED
jgi:hypothetical protein